MPKFNTYSLCFAALLSTSFIAPTPPAIAQQSTQSQQATSPLLTNERWEDQCYGFSILTPANTQVINNTSDGSIVKFMAKNQYNLSVDIIKSDRATELAPIAIRSKDQFLFAYPSAVEFEKKDELFRINHTIPALRQYLYVNDKIKGNWILGQTFIQIDPVTFALIDIEFKANIFNTIEPLYKAVCDSVQLRTPEELDIPREKLINNGKSALENFNLEQACKILPKEQWFRVIRNGQDIGYTQRTHKKSKQLLRDGVIFKYKSLVHLNDADITVKNSFFESFDNNVEIWTIEKWNTNKNENITAKTDQGKVVSLPKTTKSTITGMRTYKNLKVIVETESRIQEPCEWKIPEGMYISQLRQMLLPAFLPADQPNGYSFYGFDTDTQELSIMSAYTMPDENAPNKFWAEFLPTLNASPMLSCYSTDHATLRTEEPNGIILVPTTPQELKKIEQRRKHNRLLKNYP